jgi:uncharacterized membrane protein YbhN (UPF0104 family)
MVNMLYLVPTPPGGVGTTEWFYSIVFTAGFGVARERLGGVIIFLHVVSGVAIIVMGVWALVGLGARTFLVPDAAAWKRISAEE